MYVNPLQVSLETLIGASPLLGHRLEDRSRIRDAQDRALLQSWQARSTTQLAHFDQQDLFCVAPIDILVAERDGVKEFHPIELNGTGIGGLTNLTPEVISCVLDDLAQMAERLDAAAPVILVASSGKEMDDAPRLNRLLHEKILYAEAIKRGLEYTGRPVRVTTVDQLVQDSSRFAGQALVVLGYIKDFLDRLSVTAQGVLTLADRTVTAAVNDRFCLNVIKRFDHAVDLDRLWTMNRCFLAGGDKGVFYTLLNEYLRQQRRDKFPRSIAFASAADRQQLVDTVLDWVRAGKKAVIKPQGTGLGHGIEFFLNADEAPAHIIERIDRSLRLTEEYYKAPGGALPYTVCEYIDTCTIPQADHPLHGHKFEMRVVVYRDGMALKAFPLIAKIASHAYDAAMPAHLSLINNITTSAQAKKADGSEFMLPLANRKTLDFLGIRVDEVQEVCAMATELVRFILDKVQSSPELLGLPALARRLQPAAPFHCDRFMAHQLGSSA
jgi:hypothetical protein